MIATYKPLTGNCTKQPSTKKSVCHGGLSQRWKAVHFLSDIWQGSNRAPGLLFQRLLPFFLLGAFHMPFLARGVSAKEYRGRQRGMIRGASSHMVVSARITGTFLFSGLRRCPSRSYPRRPGVAQIVSNLPCELLPFFKCAIFLYVIGSSLKDERAKKSFTKGLASLSGFRPVYAHAVYCSPWQKVSDGPSDPA